MTITALPKSAIAIDGGAGSATFAIDRTYAEGASYQWAVELFRNVLQVQERMVAAGNPDADKVEAWFDFLTSSPRLKAGDSLRSPEGCSCFIEVAPLHLCGGESDTISTG